MSRKQRQYSQTFRDEAVSLVRDQGLSAKQAAHDLGISVWTLRGWLSRTSTEPKSEQGKAISKDERLRQLEEEVRQLKMEREILKKATAFFAREKP